jgi:hypothetical protein
MFENNRWYSDAQQADIFSVSRGTIPNWRKFYGYPAGRVFGRVRRELGRHLNKWADGQKREKIALPDGMGKGPHPGRPRKNLPPHTAA